MAYRTSTSLLVEDEAPDLGWTLALAGGDGQRLAEYITHRFGTGAPKQYGRLLGERSLLQQTLDRTNQVTPAARTLTVIGAHHAELAMPQLAGLSDHVLRQPSARDTGMALYVALAMIRRFTPNAIVTVTPSDHFAAPSAAYVTHLRAAQRVAAQLRDRVLLLGATPTVAAASDLGAIQLGPPLSEVPSVHAVCGLGAATGELPAGRALWNTTVAIGTVDALWELGREAEPQLLDILDSLVPLVGTADEDDALDYIYRAYLPVNFACDVLALAPWRLAAMELRGVEWSDFGRPERIEAVLARGAVQLVADGEVG